MEEWNSPTEVIAMSLIANSGTGKSLAFEALKKAKAGDLDGAKTHLKEAKEFLHKAHTTQIELLQGEAKGKGIDISILLVHAQDHLMIGMFALEMIEEFIELYAEQKGVNV